MSAVLFARVECLFVLGEGGGPFYDSGHKSGEPGTRDQCQKGTGRAEAPHLPTIAIPTKQNWNQ